MLSVWDMSGAFAQSANTDVKQFLMQVQQAYKQSPYLSFRVNYQYMNVGGNSDAMDSLSGEMQMDKGRCRMLLDGTETVATGHYVLQIMPQDKAIYLSGARASSMIDPVQMLDSMFQHMKDVRGAVVEEGSLKVLTLEFPPGNIYTRIRMAIDGRTGYFNRITYKVHTENLVGRDMVDRPGHAAPYQPEGEVNMFFSGYEKGRFSDALFDENNFFTRVATGKFEPSERYRGYHIFLASSNL
jgi:hypothetical protein